MKQILTFLIVFASFYASSQAVANATAPDPTICACDNAILDNSTSTAGGSPIVYTIWSIIGPTGTIADTTSFPQQLSVQLCTPGVYDVSLINIHLNGTASVWQGDDVLTVTPNPIASISAVVNSCTFPFGVTYANATPIPGITSVWTFEGGSPTTFTGDFPPLQNYNTADDYDVQLIVTDAITGCDDTAFRTINISSFESNIIVAPAPLCAGVPIQFTDNSTVGANTWNWTFQNGSVASSGSQNPTVSFPAGTHTIALQSGNTGIGCTGQTSIEITVLPLPEPEFTATPLLGCSPLPVTFTNLNIEGGASYVWNYGDGTPTFAGTNSPIHVYVGNGSYTPTLTMTGSNGCSAIFSDPIVVLSSPVSCFSQTENTTCEPKNVTLNPACSTAPGTIATYTWDFGDGSPIVVSTSAAPVSHDYLCGEWTPSLVIEMQSGCKDTLFGTEIKVGTHKTPNFFVDHHNDCIKKPFELTDITQIDCPHGPEDIVRTWLFNQVPGGADSVFLKIFPDTMQNIGPNGLPGTDVGLIINFRGCIDTTLTVDSIYISAPVSKFSLSQTKFCDLAFNPNPLTKQVTISDMQSIYGHKWNNNLTPENPTILDSTVANQNFDDVRLTYKMKEAGLETVLLVEENEPFLDDNINKGANVDPTNSSGAPATSINPVTGEITFTFDHYGSFDIWQIIENKSSLGVPTGCIDSSMVHVDVSWVETDYVFDIDGVDAVCINNEFDFTSTSGTHGIPNGAVLNPHGPLSHSFNMVSGGTVSGTSTDATESFSHTYFVPGVYDVLLTTTNSVGCSNTATHQITAFALPVASFTLDDFNGCVGIPYTSTATNTSTHPAGSFGASGPSSSNWASTDAFHWTISPNGGTATTPTLSVYNPSPATVINNTTTYSLFVIDGFGCQSPTVSVTANVQSPVADVFVPATVCNGTSVDAVDNSSGQQPMQRFWYFNRVPDGSTPDGTGPVLTNTLTSSGLSQTYTYNLIVIDAEGCPDTMNVAKTVTVSKPVADFTDVRSGSSINEAGEFTCPPVVVDFTNTSQVRQGGSIVSTAWYFNTVNNIPLPGYAAFPQTLQNNPVGIQYLFAGIYDVALIIIDDVGCRDTLERDDFLEIGGPSADAQISLNSGICGQDFTFEVLSKDKVENWTWTLGDGTTISSADEPDDSFVHAYSGVQSYSPQLIIYDNVGCAVPYDTIITILPNGVTANFTMSPDEVNLGTIVTMDPTGSNSDSGNILTWDWTFGDGTDSTMITGSNITHQYYVGGEVPVTLLVTDDRGCKDDLTLYLTIDVKFEMPNVFTGFGSDGPNADLQLFADVFKDFEILIVNRWGNVVYEGVRNPQKGRFLWDGIDQKSGKLCNDGTYFYKLKGVLKNDVEVDIHGFVTLVASTRP